MSVPGILGGLRSQPGNLMLGYGPILGDMIQAGAGLVSHWPLNEGSGTVGHDYKAAHEATLHGSPTFSVASAPGQFSLTLNTGDFITTAGTINMATGGVECWIRLAAFPASGNGLVAGFYDSATKTDKCLYVTSVGQLFWLVNDGGAKGISSGVALSLNRWYHLVGVADGTNAILYQNGLPVATTPAGNTIANYVTTGNFYIGGGTTDTWVKLSGRYSEAAVFSTAPTAANILARYNEGLTNVFSENARITQVAAEVLRDSSIRKSRTTQVAAEVLRDSSIRKDRTTQVAVEVLVNSSAGSNFSVAATNAVLFSYSNTRVRNVFSVATNAILFTPTSTGLDGHNFSVSATNAILFTPSTSEFTAHTYNVAADNAVLFTAASAEVRDVASVAANSFTVSAQCIEIDTVEKFLSATSDIIITPTSSAIRDIVLDVSNSWTFTYAGSEVADLNLNAGNAVLFDWSAYNFGQFDVFVNASNSINLTPTLAKKGDLNYVETSSIRFTCVASAYVSPIYVSATTSFQFDQNGRTQHLAILNLSAVSRVGVKSLISANYNRAIHATSAIALSPVGSRSKAIFVSASTSISVTPSDGSNQFPSLAGLGSVIFTGIAGIQVTGTLAGSRLVFTDLAEASVWFPWLRTTLTRPPGGGLPHS